MVPQRVSVEDTETVAHQDVDDAKDAAAAAAAAGSRLNMCSAFLHVLADCMRSTTTLTEAVLIGWYGFDSERTDAIASLIVSATILLGCAAAAAVWVRSALRFCSDNAKSNRSTCRSSRTGKARAATTDFGFVGQILTSDSDSIRKISPGDGLYVKNQP